MTFAITPWDDLGIAAIEASGADRRAALDAALHAVLALAVPEALRPVDLGDTRSAPLRGEGEDLPSLLADLMEDLLAQLAEFGAAALDVSVDGVVRRNDGGLVAWGYLSVAAPAAPGVAPLLVQGQPEATEAEDSRITLRAALARDAPP